MRKTIDIEEREKKMVAEIKERFHKVSDYEDPKQANFVILNLSARKVLLFRREKMIASAVNIYIYRYRYIDSQEAERLDGPW